jgi:hypothetical protein
MIKVFVFVFFADVCAFAQQPAQSTTQTVWQYGVPLHRMAIQNKDGQRKRSGLQTSRPAKRYSPERRREGAGS